MGEWWDVNEEQWGDSWEKQLMDDFSIFWEEPRGKIWKYNFKN